MREKVGREIVGREWGERQSRVRERESRAREWGEREEE